MAHELRVSQAAWLDLEDVPSHVFFYRVGSDGVVEIVRFLHESMDHQRHLTAEDPQE